MRRIALTTGEPAGIGPDLAILLAQQDIDAEIITLACPSVLQQRAQQLGVSITIEPFDENSSVCKNPRGTIKVLAHHLAEPATAGSLNTANSRYVLDILDTAIAGCQSGLFDAMVTCPVQKSVINEADISFSGHTEYLADKTHSKQVVMMLASDVLRVCLATTHLPLKDVSAAINQELLTRVITVMTEDLQRYFGIKQPHILVAGLNPHAGESGHLGDEEITTITPCIQRLQKQGFNLSGPLPADTLFTQKYLKNADAVLAMYHDQGLPVLKYQSFGRACNITLGLPIIRTSVDHGTALDLAGTGSIDPGSLITAINQAIIMAGNLQHDWTSSPA